jgi:hypothetical protein
MDRSIETATILKGMAKVRVVDWTLATMRGFDATRLGRGRWLCRLLNFKFGSVRSSHSERNWACTGTERQSHDQNLILPTLRRIEQSAT